MRHPRDMGATEVEAFLTMLAADRHVASSIHNQALSALLFLCREVLGVDLPDGNLCGQAHAGAADSQWLTREEVTSLFQFLDGERALLGRSAGMPAPCGRPTTGRSAPASSAALTPT